MKFLDTNIILRYLLWDDPIKAKDCDSLFRKLKDDKESLFTSTLVITEVIWNLEKGYKISKNEVIAAVEEIMNTPNLELDEREFILAALSIYKVNEIDFVDAYNAAVMSYKGIDSIYSYDKHYEQLPEVKRLEP